MTCQCAPQDLCTGDDHPSCFICCPRTFQNVLCFKGRFAKTIAASSRKKSNDYVGARTWFGGNTRVQPPSAAENTVFQILPPHCGFFAKPAFAQQVNWLQERFF